MHLKSIIKEKILEIVAFFVKQAPCRDSEMHLRNMALVRNVQLTISPLPQLNACPPICTRARHCKLSTLEKSRAAA